MPVESGGWSGEGAFTQHVLDRLRGVEEVAALKVEDAPSTRSEADYNFVANEIFVTFATVQRDEPAKLLGTFRTTRRVSAKAMTFDGLVKLLEESEGIGPAGLCRRRHDPVPADRARHPAVPDQRVQADRAAADLRIEIKGRH